MRDVLRIVTPATAPAVAIDEFKQHARIEDALSDNLAVMYLAAAEAHVSRSLGRATKETDFAQDVFWWRRRIDLLMPPLKESGGVTAVRVRGSDGTLSLADPSTYQVMRTAEGRGSVVFAATYTRPFYFGSDAIASVEFTAGETTVSEGIRHAIIVLAATMFDNRSLVSPVPQSTVPVLGALTSTYWDPAV